MVNQTVKYKLEKEFKESTLPDYLMLISFTGVPLMGMVYSWIPGEAKIPISDQRFLGPFILFSIVLIGSISLLICSWLKIKRMPNSRENDWRLYLE